MPARLVIGLVYVPAERGFAFHMWNEVWVNRRWVPLDAMLGRGGVGAARLKVADTNLAGASPYAALLPVVPVLRRSPGASAAVSMWPLPPALHLGASAGCA